MKYVFRIIYQFSIPNRIIIGEIEILKRLKKNNPRGISTVLATLMMIVIVVAASLISYAWFMGYLFFTSTKAGKAIQIQSVVNSGADLAIYVQNVGEGSVTFDPSGSVYIGEKLQYNIGINNPDGNTLPNGVLGQGSTAVLLAFGQAVPEGERVTIKVVTRDGTSIEAVLYPQKLV